MVGRQEDREESGMVDHVTDIIYKPVPVIGEIASPLLNNKTMLHSTLFLHVSSTFLTSHLC